MIGVISWYLFSLVLAAVNLPLAYAAMKKLPSRGGLFAATVGSAVVGEHFLVVNLYSTYAQRPGFAGDGADDPFGDQPGCTVEN